MKCRPTSLYSQTQTPSESISLFIYIAATFSLHVWVSVCWGGWEGREVKRPGRLSFSVLYWFNPKRRTKGQCTCTTAQSENALVNIQHFFWQHFLPLGKWPHQNNWDCLCSRVHVRVCVRERENVERLRLKWRYSPETKPNTSTKWKLVWV